MKRSLTVLAFSLLAATPAWALSVAAVGDIMMGTNFPDTSPVVERDFFRIAQPILANNDIRFGNFEGTLYDGGQNADGKASGAHRYLFRTPTQMVNDLVHGGFNAVTLANNHSHDFGQAGIASTKRTLTQAGVKFTSKDGEVAEFMIQGQSVALIGTDFYRGRRSITTPTSTYAEIRSLKRSHDIVIVSSHAGGEGLAAEHTYNRDEIFLGEDRGNSVAFAHEAIEAGADLILMSGPHVPRGLEIYGDRLIAYSLGNFVTERGISIGGNAGLAPLLQVELDAQGRFVSGQITSFRQIRGAAVSLDLSQHAFRLMQQMSNEDFPATKPVFVTGGVILPSAQAGAIQLRAN